MKIPAPAASDRETVVTALETAAAFDAKGNAAEALHWVKRAVQFAGEAGDDVRALALAHVAAALTTAAQSIAPNGSVPAQPSGAPMNGNGSARPRKLPPPLPAARVSERPGAAGSLAPRSPSRPPAPSSRPARPSRPAPSPPKPSLATPPPLSMSPSMTPSLANSALSRAPSAGREPQAASLRPTLPTVAQAAPRISQVPNVSSSSGSAAQSALPTPTAAELELQSAQIAAGEKSSVRTIQRSVAAPLLRQTARVSVVASPDERGLFLVRMLAEGESPAPQAAEALLVVLDPKATVLSR